MAILGPAIADFFTFTVYNAIRCIFLYRKFKLQPFTVNSIYALLLGGAAFLICQLAFGSRYGLSMALCAEHQLPGDLCRGGDRPEIVGGHPAGLGNDKEKDKGAFFVTLRPDDTKV